MELCCLIQAIYTGFSSKSVMARFTGKQNFGFGQRTEIWGRLSIVSSKVIKTLKNIEQTIEKCKFSKEKFIFRAQYGINTNLH